MWNCNVKTHSPIYSLKARLRRFNVSNGNSLNKFKKVRIKDNPISIIFKSQKETLEIGTFRLKMNRQSIERIKFSHLTDIFSYMNGGLFCKISINLFWNKNQITNKIRYSSMLYNKEVKCFYLQRIYFEIEYVIPEITGMIVSNYRQNTFMDCFT